MLKLFRRVQPSESTSFGALRGLAAALGNSLFRPLLKHIRQHLKVGCDAVDDRIRVPNRDVLLVLRKFILADGSLLTGVRENVHRLLLQCAQLLLVVHVFAFVRENLRTLSDVSKVGGRLGECAQVLHLAGCTCWDVVVVTTNLHHALSVLLRLLCEGCQLLVVRLRCTTL